MRWICVASLFVTVACAPRPMASPPVAPAQIAPRVTYWFSSAQKETLISMGDINTRHFHPMFVDGKEYTECQRAAEPIGRFKDYIVVASKSSAEPGPCGHDAGEWE